MSGFLLDTNVLSEFSRRSAPDQLVKQWLETADSESLYASILAFGESGWELNCFLEVNAVRS